MSDLHLILPALWITACIACVTYYRRSDTVLKERHRVVDIIHKLSEEDIKNDMEWEWRYKEFESIKYTDMLLPFWRPVESFYKDMKCIQKIGDTYVNVQSSQ